MRLIVITTILGFALSSCGGEAPVAKPKTKAPNAVARDLPDGVKPSADVMRDRTVAGTWRSSKGVLKDQPDAIVQIEIADDQSWFMTLRAPGKGPVFASLQGKAGWSGQSLTGSASSPKPSPLLPFSTWSATPPSKGTISVKPITTPGPAIAFVYAGR